MLRITSLRAGFLAKLSLLVVSAGAATLVSAQTAEQLQIFQSLSPEQQEAVLKQAAGRAGGAAAAPAAGSDSQRTTDANASRRQSLRSDTGDLPSLELRPDDAVTVELALPGTMERIAAVPTNGLLAATGVSGAPATALNRRIRTGVVLTDIEKRDLPDLITQVLARNPYRLNHDGQLILPGFPPISLGGLSEQQATDLLALQPSLLKLDVSLTRLSLTRTGVEGLKPYGYDLFDAAPSTFSPVTDVPVPADYVMGPGDELNVQLFGSQNRTLNLVVNRDGSVTFPELGPMDVAGRRFSAAKIAIESRVAQQMIGVRANVSMGDMRSIRVFVLGEARQAGSYAVSGLATMTTALFAAGGVKPIGSLRDIQLKRQGTVIRHLDLYDMLIGGDTSNDAKLLPGDVIFIPPVGPTVSIHGEVKRPAIYELRGEVGAAELLRIAGGLEPDADPTRASLLRVNEQFKYEVLNVNFTQANGRAQTLRNGDVLRVAKVRPQLDSGVVLEGFVHRPGPVAWHEGMRLTDLIGSIDELKPNADAHYVLIRRESGVDRRVDAKSADLVAALGARGTAADVALMPRDEVTVFDLAPGRERVIKPLLDELRLQSGLSRPTDVVEVRGRVKVPGEYPLEPGMRIGDLLRAGGGLDAAAYGGKAELTRYELDGDGARQTELIEINLAALLRDDPQANIVLRPFDYLLIREVPNWTDQESITLIGEFKFPDTYPIRRGETLRQVIDRAGGLTSRAFTNGSVFTRVELKEREQRELDLLADRTQSDLAALSLQAAAANQAGASQSLSAGQSWLAQLRQSKAVGRLVIDLPALLAGAQGSDSDVVLKNGDVLRVPVLKQEVTVIGEVQSPTSHFYSPALGRDDYIGLSGGMTRKADKSRIYIVRADGSVVAQEKRVFRRDQSVTIQPGDTVVVPLDTERVPRLPFWQAVTQIVYNLAISVAAINSF